MNELFDLKGKTALITGFLARHRARDRRAHGGARRTVVIRSRKIAACDEVAQGIVGRGGQAIALACNVSNKEELAAAGFGDAARLREDRRPGVQRRGQSALRTEPGDPRWRSRR